MLFLRNKKGKSELETLLCELPSLDDVDNSLVVLVEFDIAIVDDLEQSVDCILVCFDRRRSNNRANECGQK